MPASPDTLCPLQPFARSGETPVRALVASAARDGAVGLHFRYVLEADLGAVRIPAVQASGPADELWKHTCFEAFIASGSPDTEGGYLELNFSPSSQWAVYSFESYRKGMTPVTMPAGLRIGITRSGTRLMLDAYIPSQTLLPDSWLAPGAKLRIALSAVIEDDSGRISYWALKHAPDKPDFHHAAGFILEV